MGARHLKRSRSEERFFSDLLAASWYQLANLAPRAGALNRLLFD